MSNNISSGVLYNAAGLTQTPLRGSRKADTGKKSLPAESVKNTRSAQSEAVNTQTVKLSEKAQAMLDKLKERYGDKADIMVADYNSDEEAQQIMGRGTKEYSILLSEDELEKMADDEEYENGNYEKIDSAMTMGQKLMEEFSEDSDTQITRFGISFNSDGSTSFFAELEKVSEGQKSYMENVKAQKAAEKEAAEEAEEAKKAETAEEKAAEAKAEKAGSGNGFAYGLEKNPNKTTTLYASSEEELAEQIKALDWSTITTEARTQGGRVDFSI